MELFWFLPLVLLLGIVIWWVGRKVKSEGGEPMNPPQGPRSRADE
jgi:hypothetical protein